MSLFPRSSAWETGVGNFPAGEGRLALSIGALRRRMKHTLGETGTEETRNLLDESLGGQESIVLLSEFLDELLVLVEPEDV